jgi:hypothetical protein
VPRANKDGVPLVLDTLEKTLELAGRILLDGKNFLPERSDKNDKKISSDKDANN